MEIITSLEQLHKFSAPCVVALGTFDGLHRGHLDVIETAREKARECNSQLAVFTFSNHPFEWIRPGMVPPALITGAQKQELLQQLLEAESLQDGASRCQLHLRLPRTGNCLYAGCFCQGHGL